MARGGVRPGAGRKQQAPTETMTIYIPAPQAERLKAWAKMEGISIGKMVARLVDESSEGGQ